MLKSFSEKEDRPFLNYGFIATGASSLLCITCADRLANEAVTNKMHNIQSNNRIICNN